jgi:hypothetical protein
MPFSISSLRRTGAALPQMGVLWPRSQNGRVACAHPTPHRSDLCPRRLQGGRGCHNQARVSHTAATFVCKSARCAFGAIVPPARRRRSESAQNRLRGLGVAQRGGELRPRTAAQSFRAIARVHSAVPRSWISSACETVAPSKVCPPPSLLSVTFDRPPPPLTVPTQAASAG